jgi:acetyl esterase/lipase
MTQAISAILIVMSLATHRSIAQQPDAILDLWVNSPPGLPLDVGPEQDMTKDTDPLIAGKRIIKLGNVEKPQAHVYLPPANLRTGAAVVVCPGGGFSILAWDLEGIEVAQWLTRQGIAAIVLKYRVPTRTQDPNWLAPTQDTQRTISIVRSRAEDWKLDREKIGVLGFSAGGVTAAKASLAAERLYPASDATDQFPCHINRTVLIYSGGLPADDEEKTLETWNITPKTPPMFMVHTFDDFVPVSGTANMLLALRKAGVPCELHVFDAGEHGYGLRFQSNLPVTKWPDLCTAWLHRAGWCNP